MTGIIITTYLQMFSNTKLFKRRSKMKKVTDYHICENELCENPYCTCNPCLCAPDDECPCCVGTPD
jgi:hypothetical protein